MKKLLFILFLLPVIVNAQGFGLQGSSRAFINNAVATIGSQSYTSGRTYVYFFCTTVSSGNPTDNPTISSGSLTLVKQGTIASGGMRIIAYTCSVTSTTTTAITATYAETQGRFFYVIYHATAGIDTHTAILTNTNNATGTDPSITMPSVADSYTMGIFMNKTSPFGSTPESGWTEDEDVGLGGPFGETCVSRNNTTDNTIQLTSASSEWIGLGIQFANARRIFNQ